MDINHPDLIYWIAATYLDGVGPVRLRKLLNYFDHIKDIFTASEITLQQVGFTLQQIKNLQILNWKKIESDIQWCEKNKVAILLQTDDAYPKQLNEIASAPIVLYVQGDPSLLQLPQLAIIGARNPTAIGIETAELFAQALIQAGVIVTSGLAMGIDAAGHRGALYAKGKTIAIMGTGLQYIYPRINSALANEIQNNGALVSEFPLGAPAKGRNFPLRNRLISGLSMGVLVVEAALKSGSLITARFAIEQGREVFAIPGSIHQPLAKGCHYLIQQGAKLVESIEDILIELPPLREGILNQPKIVFKSQALDDLGFYQKKFLMQVGYEPTSVDALVSRSGLTTSEVSSMLLVLELKGYISAVAGGYCRI